jgi:hypothetical protein
MRPLCLPVGAGIASLNLYFIRKLNQNTKLICNQKEQYDMLEVKGKANVVWVFAGFGIGLSTFGWYSLAWVEDLGKLWEIIAISLMISGVLIAGIGVWRAVDKRPILVVDEQGLLDRTSLPTRRIAWSEIEGFSLITVSGREPTWLAIQLANPELFISKAMFGAAAMLESFEEKYGTPCLIALRSLDAEPNGLLIRLKDALSRRKR